MKANFISMPSKNKRLVEDAVGTNKLFVAPFDVIALVANSGRVYAKTNIEDLKVQINKYPLQHGEWVKAQS